MQKNMKKLLSVILAIAMLSSLLVTSVISLTSMAAGDAIDSNDAPYAGVYAVTTDKAVTLTSEIGSTVTLQAGGTGYLYLTKGANNLKISDSSANLTITVLENNGMDYIGQVSIPKQPILDPDVDKHDQTSGTVGVTLAAGESRTFTHTSNYGAGIYYPYIAGTGGGTVRVTTDTGYYADILLISTASSSAWADANHQDPEMVYLRAGQQTITLTNTGSTNVYISVASFGTAGVLKDAAYWKDQMNVASLKVVTYDPTVTPTPEPTPTPTPTPSPTPTAVPENVITYTAPAAGVYPVTSNKAVTLVNETGSKVVLAAGETKYIYLIEGANKITTTDKSASLTFVQLAGNGLSYIDQITVDSIPYSKEHTLANIATVVDSEGVYQAYNGVLILDPGASVTVKANISAKGAGIVYPFLNVSDNYEHTFKVSSDTGFYADLLKNATGYQTTCWTDGIAQQDMEFLYLRAGENLITIENTGANTATIGSLRLSMTDGDDSIKNHAVWGPQINLKSLKTLEKEIVATPEPTAPPAATHAPVGTITYDAPYGGIYRVASDKAVTLINETGSTATLSGSGIVKYLYLLKGVNKISTSDLSADITFNELEGYGMTYMSKIETVFVPYGEEHYALDVHNFVEADGTYEAGTNAEGKFLNMSPGSAVTFEVNVSAKGAGLIYPYIGFRDVLENTFEVTSDTGFYAEIVKPAAGGSFCWADGSAQQDMEFLYMREGKNLVTIRNTGANDATLTAFRISMTDGEDSLANHAVWGPQMNLANLKVNNGGSSAEPTATPAPVLPDVSNTNLYTVIEAETAGTSTTYNGKTAVKFDHEIVTTATYTFTADQETVYNLNLVGAAWKDVSFDLYVDNVLLDYATMHFDNNRTGSAWVYLQEKVASVHVGAGTHTLKFVFYCDTFYLDSIVLEDTNSMFYHLIHDFRNVTTSEGAYNLLKQYGSAAGINVDTDTVNHVYAPMSFWNMVAKNYETGDEMLAAYQDCLVDPTVVVKNNNGQEVATLPAGTAYVSVDCMNIPSEATLIAAVYNGKQLVAINEMTRADGAATTAFTSLSAGCKLKVFVLSDMDEMKPYSKDVYGTPYREIYVATNGKSSNAGTQDAPVNNLANALKLVKTMNSNMTGDIIVHMAPGTYRSTVSIDIDPTMGGKNGHKVIIRADEPGKTVLSGGEDLTGKWTKVEGKNYYVATTATRDTRALFVNGYQATLARSDGWYAGVLMKPSTPKNDSHVTEGIQLSLTGQNKNFPQGLDQQTEVQASRMHIVFSLQWANHRFPLDRIAYNASSAYIYTTYPYYNAFCIDGLHTSTITPDGGADFYLENSLLLLDKPGEFYFDKETRQMYYYPYAQEDMTTIETWCSVADRMVSITGVGSNNKVTNLEFDGIAFRHGGYDDITVKGAAFNQTEEWRIGSETYYGQHIFPGQIWVNYADSLVFNNCEFGSMGSSAIIFEEGVSNSKITGSYFHDLAGTGVVLGDYRDGNSASSTTERCRNIIVDNNVFRRTAQEYQGLTAISLYYVSNATITHNDIKDTSYSGIVIGWGWGYDDPAECGNHTISYNKIDDVMQTMGDGSHIYTLGNLRGTQINDNYLIDPGQIKAPGIYFDQGTGYTNACDNVVVDAYTNSSEYWLFARQLVNINNCFVGYNHTDGRDPTKIYGTNGTSTSDVAFKYNKYRVSSWSTAAQRIMAEAGLEDKSRLGAIAAYPSWRTMRMMDIPQN